MRIQHLDLIRYGKFSERRLEFPAAAQDFHFIVGPNEAGKSTTRSAILDLLYGFPHRSAYAFLHGSTELRLGGLLQQGEQSLAIQRSKSRSKSLLDAQGQVLPESVLSAFLGSSDRAFFEQMFGLDHGRLLAGGDAILNAANDVGQILFQSAAGIASLGPVREQLEAEADGLWARRKSGERAYYIAADQLATADAALKAATVRTKDWLEARQQLEALQQRRGALLERLRALQVQRLALERLRRVLPTLRQWQSVQGELASLGQAQLLPADAGARWQEAERERGAARAEQAWLAEQAAGLRQRLAALPEDADCLAQAEPLQALLQRHQEQARHGEKIAAAEAELALLRQQLQQACQRLAWPLPAALEDADADAEAEAALAARLPALPQRSGFAGLARQHGLLLQAGQLAEEGLLDKQRDLQALEAQLQKAAGGPPELPPALLAALADAQAAGDTEQAAQRAEHALARAEAELAQARAAWPGASPQPGASACESERSLPGEARVQQLLQQSQQLDQALRHGLAQQAELAREQAALELAIEQYRQAHAPVELPQLLQAREQRDALWAEIKVGGRAPGEAAAPFETQLQRADELADRRHATAHESSELLLKSQALERLRLQAQSLGHELDRLRAEAATLSADWQALARAAGADAVAPGDFEAWRRGRTRWLQADAELARCRQELAAQQAAAEGLRRALRDALLPLQPELAEPAAQESLGALRIRALQLQQLGVAAAARAEQMERQREELLVALQRERQRGSTAAQALADWQTRWQAGTAALGLPADLPPSAAETVLACLMDIEQGLAQLRELRQGRLASLRREQRALAEDLRGLSERLNLPWGGVQAAVQELRPRLARALDAQREGQRLRQELEQNQRSQAAAEQRLRQAEQGLAPLFQQAGLAATANDAQALLHSIERSEQRRTLEQARQRLQEALDEGGDGLSLSELQAEAAAHEASHEAAQLPLQLAELARQMEALGPEQEQLGRELSLAQQALDAIAGQDAAARAEGQRQDALARMSNAAERYLKVHTAARLLKWAIDRYRESKQGPMLSRAGEIFAGLTLGSFERLTLDFDATPPTLHGLRADGRLVGIAGMSEGTRDQLYLALRLAALELQLGPAPGPESGAGAGSELQTLPFIADDLLINYDDARSRAGLQALAQLSLHTQVIFLSHHAHLLPLVREVFGAGVSVSEL